MNSLKIILTDKNEVINLVSEFGRSMFLIYGSSLISNDADVDADTLKRFNVLENSVGRTLKIYFRKHGTFTNFNNDPSHNIEFWSERNEIIGILCIEVQSENTYMIYYEKYE